MALITSLSEMQAFSRRTRGTGKSLGLVPTMGALHKGHLSLVRQAKRQCDVVIVSILVNPTQFGPSEDYSRYPQNLERDLELLRPYKVDAVFAPTAAAMYPEGYETFVEPGRTAEPLEGACRPGHFRGVATVVLKLLNVVRPDIAYFGQKDFQQAQVIRRLVEDLNLDVRLVICPIVREADSLALSSRNAYLGTENRQAALVLSRALRRAEELARGGEADAGRLVVEMQNVFASEPRAQLEYAAVVDPVTLQPVERARPGCVALVAAQVGPARLIDNAILGPAGTSPEVLIQLALSARPIVDTRARVPGLETEALRLKIENCRECAALSSVQLPPREFLAKYLKRDYPDLNSLRVAIIARNAPINPENFLYRNPEKLNRFVEGLFELLGVRDFAEFKTRFVLTDAVRCHAGSPRVPEKALAYCAKHLREELRLFPNLDTIVVLGEDAYLQFQHLILERDSREFKPLNELLKEQGSAQEEICVPSLDDRPRRVIYCHHPTLGYGRVSSIAHLIR